MNIFYILPVLAILFQGGETLQNIDADLRLFAKLCFLPKGAVSADYSALVLEGDMHEDPYHYLIGNKVMQEKLSQFLTDNKEVSSEYLNTMCPKASVESVDAQGMSFGKVWGYDNITYTYTCQPSKDFPGIEKCNLAAKHFDEDIMSLYEIANEDVLLEINCFKSGHVGWGLLAQKSSKITEEQKKMYFAHANELGFPASTNVVMHGKNCAD